MGILSTIAAAAASVRANIVVTGRPLAERDKAASVSVFGMPFFARDDNLERTYLGVIKRGRSAYAKKALAAKAAKP
ncbi:MAG: hypothetical protein H0X39_00410 [Actinobacteria bacterium]|nr:hypothetical protein [Actinomycetota bacterium]